MTSLNLLLVEENAERATRLMNTLRGEKHCLLCVKTPAEAAEALALEQFDIVLTASAEIARAVAPVLRRSAVIPLLIGLGTDDDSAGVDAAVPLTEGPEVLAAIVRLHRFRQKAGSDAPSRLTAFDPPAFRRQMGEDEELMHEIISLFFTESAGQLKDIRNALSVGDYQRASRLAHSLKGSLGSLHALQGRHWAHRLEMSAADCDDDLCRHSLSALEKAISELEPMLRSITGSNSGTESNSG